MHRGMRRLTKPEPGNHARLQHEAQTVTAAQRCRKDSEYPSLRPMGELIAMTAKTDMEREVVFTLPGLQLLMDFTRGKRVSVELYAGMRLRHS